MRAAPRLQTRSAQACPQHAQAPPRSDFSKKCLSSRSPERPGRVRGSLAESRLSQLGSRDPAPALHPCQPPPPPGSVLPAVPSPEPGRTEPGRAGPPRRGRSPWRPSSRRRPWTVSSGPDSWLPGSGTSAAARRCPRGWAQLGRPTGDHSCVTPAPQPHLGGSSSRWHSPHPRFLLCSLSPPSRGIVSPLRRPSSAGPRGSLDLETS